MTGYLFTPLCPAGASCLERGQKNLILVEKERGVLARTGSFCSSVFTIRSFCIRLLWWNPSIDLWIKKLPGFGAGGRQPLLGQSKTCCCQILSWPILMRCSRLSWRATHHYMVSVPSLATSFLTAERSPSPITHKLCCRPSAIMCKSTGRAWQSWQE